MLPLFLFVFIIIVWFGLPWWLIWVVHQLFNVDWSHKYWAVWGFIMIVNAVLTTNRRNE